MGFDTPLAVLSKKPQSLFTYFKQQFAQVTNPPIDAIREQLVIGTEVFIGPDANVAADDPKNARKVKLSSPMLTTPEFEKLRHLDTDGFHTQELSICYAKSDRQHRLQQALDDLFRAAETAVDAGKNLLILTDRDAGKEQLVMPILLAVSGLNNYLVRKGKRGRASILVDTGEACEVHHYAALMGYGASAIHPYGVYATLKAYGMSDALETYRHAAEKGIIKSCLAWGSPRSPVIKAPNCLKQSAWPLMWWTNTSPARKVGSAASVWIKSKPNTWRAMTVPLGQRLIAIYHLVAPSSIAQKANTIVQSAHDLQVPTGSAFRRLQVVPRLRQRNARRRIV